MIARERPIPRDVVERFAAAVSAGDRSAAYALLSQGAVCEAGQLIRFSWDVIDADAFAVAATESDCPHFARIAHMPFTFRRLHEE